MKMQDPDECKTGLNKLQLSNKLITIKRNILKNETRIRIQKKGKNKNKKNNFPLFKRNFRL